MITLSFKDLEKECGVINLRAIIKAGELTHKFEENGVLFYSKEEAELKSKLYKKTISKEGSTADVMALRELEKAERKGTKGKKVKVPFGAPAIHLLIKLVKDYQKKNK